MMTRPRLFAAAVAMCAAILGSDAQAASIGINFGDGGFVMAAADEPGVVTGANWNNAVGGSGFMLLNDNAGNATTADVSWSAAGAFDVFGTPATGNSATNAMYSGGLFGDSNTSEVFVTISNISYLNYAVYVYASSDEANDGPMSISNGTTTYYYQSGGSGNAGAASLLLTTSTNPLLPTNGQAQYQIFQLLNSPTFSLSTGGSINGLYSNNVFGLQIVELTEAAPVPEPGTLALMGLGLALVAGRQLRRKA